MIYHASEVLCYDSFSTRAWPAGGMSTWLLGRHEDGGVGESKSAHTEQILDLSKVKRDLYVECSHIIGLRTGSKMWVKQNATKVY